MSGNEPTWNEDDETPTSGDMYGAPKGTPRPGDETADELEPMGFVEPLSLDDDDSDEMAELIFDENDDVAPASTPVPSGAHLADDDDADLGPGNRPAVGARVVSASEIFSEDFIGAEGASDFLGLDTDFDPMPIPKDGGGLDLDVRDAPAAGVATETEFEEDGYVSPISAPEADPEFAAAGYEPEYDDEIPGDLGFDDDDLLGDDAFDDVPLPAKGRRGLVVAAAFVLGLVAVGAAVYGPGFFGGGEQPVEVASNGGGTTKPKVTPQPGGVTTADPTSDPVDGTTPDLDPIDGGVDPLDPNGPNAGLVDLGVDPEVGIDTTPGIDPTPEIVDPVDPIDLAPIMPVVDSAQSELLKKLLAESAELERLNPGSGGLLDLVWRGESVPMEAISASGRILTPSVGPVRVHMATLDVFDGRLFAVGENKVWIDLDLGRIGLDGAAIDRIERLPHSATTKTLEASDLVMGGRVRASVPGGVIYGRVRSQNGNSVTLVTDSGARITLVDAILENVGEKKSVVLKR